MMSDMGWGWAGMIIGPIMMIVALILIVLLVRWLVESRHGGTSHNPPDKMPLEILRERYAKGEIDKEEFEERRRGLGE